MPASWQDYQELQKQMSLLAAPDALRGNAPSAAAAHEEKLHAFYPTFKDILA